MKILVTGATSKLGQALIPELLKNSAIEKLYILSRTKRPSGIFQLLNDSRLEHLQGDICKELFFLDHLKNLDLCIHMAAVTHSKDEQEYFEVNEMGTKKLADRLYSNGCKEFIFVSSHTAGLNAGAYAESKFLAEKYLFSMPWNQLLVLRPSEIVGAGSQEGLDKLENIARKFKIYPCLIGLREIVFSPTRIEEIVRFIAGTLNEDLQGNRVQIVRGPTVTSIQLIEYFWKKYHAMPIPVFIPLLQIVSKVLSLAGVHLFAPDQIARLSGARGQKSSYKSPLEEVILESPFRLN